MIRKATFDPSRDYRYTLYREWKDGDRCMFLMLNPSTADEKKEDPTVTRCIGFAKHWGYGSLEVCNIFSYRSTDPKVLQGLMMRGHDIIGPKNNSAILSCASRAKVIVAAWGTWGYMLGRGSQVLRMLKPFGIKHLGLTKELHPKHPLYLKTSTQLIDF